MDFYFLEHMNAEPFIVEIHDFMYDDEIIDVQEQARFPFF